MWLFSNHQQNKEKGNVFQLQASLESDGFLGNPYTQPSSCLVSLLNQVW
jgi:hypothetical protein